MNQKSNIKASKKNLIHITILPILTYLNFNFLLGGVLDWGTWRKGQILGKTFYLLSLLLVIYYCLRKKKNLLVLTYMILSIPLIVSSFAVYIDVVLFLPITIY